MANRPLLLGHRGARAEKSIPENTTASFDRALALGCDGFEFDVRLSLDGHGVVGHDATVDGLKIEKCEAARLGLPLLREVLARYQATAFLDIELKVPGLETITAELLREYPPDRGYVVSSFLPQVLQAMHSLNSATPLGLICETDAQLRLWRELPVQYVIAKAKLTQKTLISEIRTQGKKLFVWTVNSTRDMLRFAEWGADGIISDQAERLVSTLGPSSIVPHSRKARRDAAE